MRFPIHVLTIMVVCSAGRIALAQTSAFPLKIVTLFTNENGERALNSPSAPTTFTLQEPVQVTMIRTYHYNYGRGVNPGTITVSNSKGEVMGAWPATLANRFFWCIEPKLFFPADTYTITDSDHGTWSRNAKSGGKGMATVNGAVPEEVHKSVVRSLFTAQAAIPPPPGKSRVGLRPLFFAADDQGTQFRCLQSEITVGENLDIRYVRGPRATRAYWLSCDAVLTRALRYGQCSDTQIQRWIATAPARGTIKVGLFDEGGRSVDMLSIPVVIKPRAQ